MNPIGAYLRGLTERFLETVDLPLLIALLALCGIGLAVLHSAGGERVDLLYPQAARFSVGLLAMMALAQIPPAKLRLWTPWLFAATLILLALVPVFGTGRSGRHWLNLGVIYLQPSELMKLTVPMMAAWYLHRAVLPPRWGALAAAGVIVGLPVGLIMLQPDLGTAVLVAASGGFVVFLAGLQWWRIALLVAPVLAVLPIAWQFLQDYQRKRILTFLDPEADPLGAGWNIIQSKIAVGSGGLAGKGWGEGSQAKLDFLPEQTTDFIFAVLAEEFGWFGVAVTLGLFLFVVGRCLWIAMDARETYARLLAGALGLAFFVYVFVNGGMISGLLPVVGVPMPLLSYGGTSAVTLLAGFGMVMAVRAHRRFMG
jgi:rod shape determining protein RodA